MTDVQPWPTSLEGTPAIAVIEQAISRRRLSHSLLLHCEDPFVLEAMALAIADRLLNTSESPARFAPVKHPDCFSVRPAGKMRIISAEATRALIAKVQVSPSVSRRKVAILYDVERMNLQASNIFLKTLEEPPAHTTLLLLTTKPYALIPTIRSRVLHFRFPAERKPVEAQGWSEWIADYTGWLDRAVTAVASKKEVADHVFSIYGLLSRFSLILDRETSVEWERLKATLPEELDDDEQVAIETGLANGLRSRFFSDIERVTRDFAMRRISTGDSTASSSLAGAIDRLEHSASLLRLNLNESAALEDFLLASLRLWSRR